MKERSQRMMQKSLPAQECVQKKKVGERMKLSFLVVAVSIKPV